MKSFWHWLRYRHTETAVTGYFRPEGRDGFWIDPNGPDRGIVNGFGARRWLRLTRKLRR